MSTELMPYQDVKALAADVAASRLFPAFGTPQQTLVLMMLAQSEGCHPIQALQRYDVIDAKGKLKPAKKSDAMLADFQKRGGKVAWLELSDTAVEAEFASSGLAKPVRVRWTIEMAQKAGLVGKDNWRNYPRAMLRARVVSEGIRTADPGVVAGLYTPEEVQDFDFVQQPSVRTPEPAPTTDASKPIDVEATTVPASPAQENTAEASKATPDQVKVLCTVMTKLGLKERAKVLDWINKKIAPRSVESRLDLTPVEAKTCIEAAETELNEKGKE